MPPKGPGDSLRMRKASFQVQDGGASKAWIMCPSRLGNQGTAKTCQAFKELKLDDKLDIMMSRASGTIHQQVESVSS